MLNATELDVAWGASPRMSQISTRTFAWVPLVNRTGG